MHRFSLSIVFMLSMLVASYAATSTALISPRDGFDTTTTSPVTLHWKAVATVGGYTVLVSSRQDFSDTVWQTIAPTTSTLFAPTDSSLYWKSTYYWKVGTAAADTANDTAWSTAWHFVLEVAKIPVARLIGPDSGATVSTSPIIFSWHGVKQANQYGLCIYSKSPTFDTTISLTDTTKAVNLPFGSYFWIVMVYTPAGSSGSSYWEFNYESTRMATPVTPKALPSHKPLPTAVDIMGRTTSMRARVSAGMYLNSVNKHMICR